jgi:hypothetical protein
MKVQRHTRYRPSGEVVVPRHGGVHARDWRRKVAQSAVKPPDPPLRTLSFPLDIDLPTSLFPAADRLYNTVEGTGPGSLFHLLMCVHLAGVGVFQGVKEADSHRNESAFPDAQFRDAMKDELGINLPKLTPRNLYNRLKTPPKKALSFDIETLANWIHTSCAGKSMDGWTPEPVRMVMNAAAEALTRCADNYKSLADDALVALAQVGEAIQRVCPSAPSLAVVMPGESAGVPLGYTGTVEPVTDDESTSYWLHHVIACLLRDTPNAKPGEVQNALLSLENNALSNLFGAALFNAKGDIGALRRCQQAELMALLGIPPKRDADATRLHAALQAIAAPSLFQKAHYADYRPALGGKLRSWVANYLGRLKTLQAQTEALKGAQLPSAEPDALHQIVFGLGFSMEEIRTMAVDRDAAIAEASACLAVLAGRDASRRPIECAEQLEMQLQLVRDIHGHFESIANQIRQQQEVAKQADLEPWQAALSVGDADIFVLPGITGGNEDAGEAIATINTRLHSLLNSLSKLNAVVAENAGGLSDWLHNTAADELEKARAIPNRQLNEGQANELAKRRLLSGIARFATRLSTTSAEVVWGWVKPVLAEGSGKLFNRLRHNQQGRFYVSPWSPARHQPLPVDFAVFDQTDWIDSVGSLVEAVKAQLETEPSAALLQDYTEALRFHTQLLIDTRNELISTNRVRSAVNVEGLSVHYRIKVALSADTVGRKGLSALLTLFGSHLSKMRFAARREQFIVRQKFSRVGQDDLLYVPKAKQWAMPEKYRQAKGIIGQLLREGGLAPEAGPIDVRDVFAKAAKMPPETGVGHLLRQLPHDWYLPIDFRDALAQEMTGLPVGKETVRKPETIRKLVKKQAAKLIGPSTFLNQLSSMLVRQTESKEWMLILDWTYRSSVVFADGLPSLHADLAGCQARVAVPVKPLPNEDEKIGLFDNFVAIDLGERQIGYAVFNLAEALAADLPQPVMDPLTQRPANGAIRVPAVRGLINAVRSYRTKQSYNTKLRQNFDRRLEQLRENVGADIVQRIEALCARFDAFPVLESSVVNFQTGSRQLDLVYGDVVRHFTYSDVGAHGSQRAEHWMGADRWEHPYLLEQKFDAAAGKRGGAAKPLNLFPGASVNPARTSQTCTCCGRNAITALKDLGDGQVVVADGGRVATEAGELRILSDLHYPDAEFKAARRNKVNLPLNKPMKPGRYAAKEVMTALRRTMRQKNPNVMARDTSQSRFQCAFADCGVTYHADQGAAINIGRKFLAERVVKAESLRKLLVAGTSATACSSGT